MTVETSVGYEDATDAWRVILTEGAAEDPIAYLTVADDSGEVEGLNVLPTPPSSIIPRSPRTRP